MATVKNLIPHFIQDQFLLGKKYGHFQAYTMFVDLSGFTKLTETLMKQGNEGAERLSNILNEIFAPMVRLVYGKGGCIPHFAGDAFTAIFPKSEQEGDGKEVLETAEMQLIHLKKAAEKFSEFPLGIKIGLSVGIVEWGIIGRKHQSFYFRGEAIDGCANSQKKAREQQIIADLPFINSLSSTERFQKLPNLDFFILIEKNNLNSPSSDELNVSFSYELSPKVITRFLPESVIKFNQRGEFRTVISVFISFKGVPDHNALNDLVSVIIDHFNKFSGYFKEVDFGDKGGVMLGFFGAPVTFENNVERALEFVLAIQEDLKPLQANSKLKFRIGITSGMAYTGIIGGEERCQYAAVGNRVNIAARLMTKASWGEVLVDQAIQKDRHFKFKHKGDITYKGIADPIPTYKFLGKNVENRHIFEGAMIGRNEELNQLTTYSLTAFQKRQAAVAYIYGEAGIGKTRLAYELGRNLEEQQTVNWFTCQSDQILQKPFNPFIYFLKNYFEQSPENSLQANLHRFERRFQWLVKDSQMIDHPDVENIRKEVIRTKSILATLIGLKVENSLWQDLDAKGRYENTLTAIINLLLAESLIQPIVIELEDGHWYDENSLELLEKLTSKIKNLPALLLVTSRYYDDGSKPLLFKEEVLSNQNIPSFEIDLNILKIDALRVFSENKLGGKVNQEFLELLHRTTNGNPFYAEQILEYFDESNLLEKENGEWYIKDQSIKLSNSINSVLTARIDRLSTLVKETVKAAAVIGREFEVSVLTEVMRVQQAFIQKNGNAQNVLKEQIKSAEQGQIWQAMNELRYIFRHSLLREAVYDMQLRTRLRELHRLIAEAIEKIYSDDLEQRYVDLVFHFEQAGEEEKLILYLRKAADYARGHYQNQQALNFFDKLIILLEKHKKEVELITALLHKGNILELIGQWDTCEKIYDKALTLARQATDMSLLGQANNSLGYLLMLKGNYDDAGMYLEAAAAFSESLNDTKSVAKVYGNLGNLYFRQGNYEDAKSHFIRSIQMAQMFEHSTNTARIVANLGLTYMNLGKYDDGIRWQRSQLDICREKNDKQGMATLYTNLGIVYFEKGDDDEALECYQKGLAFSEDLGNKLLKSIAIGCIGSVYQHKGAYGVAMEHFEKDLVLTKELGDKQGISIALGLIGELHSIRGNFDQALDYMKQNLAISEELGYQKGIAKALNTLGDVHFYKNDFELALKYYEQAISVTRDIGNKLVLASSLIEKSSVLLAMNRVEEISDLYIEAQKIALEIGNSDLIFESKILSAKVAVLEKQKEKGIRILETLLNEELNNKATAAVYFELNEIKPNIRYKKKALTLYKVLYKATPNFLFQLRIKKLS